MNANDELIKRFSEVVDEKLAARLDPIHERLEKIEKDVHELKQDVHILKQDVHVLKKDAKVSKQNDKKLQKTQEVMLDMLNRDDVRLSKRVTRIEKHLGLPPFE